ncbi:MAG: hypothetical protein ACXAD7_00465 [Candidatus Kariarchaeaceae archaeon]|jgi:hypothetical protein
MDGLRPIKFSFSDLIGSILSKAKEDGVLSKDEADLIRQIEFDATNIQNKIQKAVNDNNTKSALDKLIRSSGENLIKNAISTARKDTSISSEEREIIGQVLSSFEELGWDISSWKKKRIWYVFKIVIYIDRNTQINDMLDAFDKKFCMRNIDPVTGICLGTNHYVLDDIDVTLLAFTLNPDNDMEWVRKGAFAYLEFTEVQRFSKQLKRTAQDLLARHYDPDKISAL